MNFRVSTYFSTSLILITLSRRRQCYIDLQANADAESVYDVISSRFGEDITRWYVDPFVRGVFAADCKQLSFKAAFPGIWQAVKNRKVSVMTDTDTAISSQRLH